MQRPALAILPEPRTRNREPMSVARGCLFTNQLGLLYMWGGMCEAEGRGRSGTDAGSRYAMRTSFVGGVCSGWHRFWLHRKRAIPE